MEDSTATDPSVASSSREFNSDELSPHARARARGWPSEHEVADEVRIDARPPEAQRVLREVPLWFHTFSLNNGLGLYTPGKARDHGYRLASIPESFAGMSVLDVGAFDGFYAFLAEARGAGRVLAIDNERYRDWVRGRWGVELRGGEGFHAISDLLNSEVEYRRMDAYELPQLDETFDVIFCFGILHRVKDPIGFLSILGDRLNPTGNILVETHGLPGDEGAPEGTILMPKPDQTYAGDTNVYWHFSSGALGRLANLAGLGEFVTDDTPMVDGHPRIIGNLTTD
jgi:tRNA (mo5U34)-methyltransferase